MNTYQYLLILATLQIFFLFGTILTYRFFIEPKINEVDSPDKNCNFRVELIKNIFIGALVFYFVFVIGFSGYIFVRKDINSEKDEPELLKVHKKEVALDADNKILVKDNFHETLTTLELEKEFINKKIKFETENIKTQSDINTQKQKMEQMEQMKEENVKQTKDQLNQLTQQILDSKRST
jgi:hypothetical protein